MKKQKFNFAKIPKSMWQFEVPQKSSSGFLSIIHHYIFLLSHQKRAFKHPLACALIFVPIHISKIFIIVNIKSGKLKLIDRTPNCKYEREFACNMKHILCKLEIIFLML